MTYLSLASTLLATTASIALAGHASAQNTGGWSFDGVPSWSNPDTGDSFTFRGRVYLDAADVDFETGGVTTNYSDSEIRTARLGVTGRFSGVRYTAELDFVNGSVTAKDVVLTFDAGAFNVQVGHMKTPNSLEEQTSSRYITFMERGTGTDLFGLDRRVGVAISGGGDNYTYQAGVYGGRPGDLSDSLELDDTSAAAARFTFSPAIGDGRAMHLGASLRHMDYGGAGTRVRVRPGTHITPRVVTADFRPGRPLGEADSSLFWGLETAYIAGPFHAHAEWMGLNVDGPAGDPTFHSGFVNLGWFLTGETRSYSGGKFGRTRPARAVSDGGFGALELALRYDVSDLDTVSAGELTTWTIGLNWYVENQLRVMANYVEGELSVPGGPDTDISGAQIRLQWDF